MCWDQPWERLDHRQSARGMPSFFSLDVGKTLILLGLRRGDLPSSGQNIGTKGLRDKILRNKELDEKRVPSPLIANWLGLGRTMPLCAFYLLGQGCSSHVYGFSLCRFVEKRKDPSSRARRAGRFGSPIRGSLIFYKAERQCVLSQFFANKKQSCLHFKDRSAARVPEQDPVFREEIVSRSSKAGSGNIRWIRNVAGLVRAFCSVVPVNCAQSCISLCSTLLVSVLPMKTARPSTRSATQRITSSHSYPPVIAD